jgi:DNA repair protein RecO (recombination protein O)
MAEQRSFRVEAVVLRHADWGEADRLLTLYTRQHGKVRAIAKGARRIRSRKAGHLEPFTHVTLQLARGRDLLIVTQADTLDAYLPIRGDLVRTGHAAYLVELIDRFTYEDDTENLAIFRLLTGALAHLEQETDPWLAVRFYEVKLLDALGYRPQLFKCANCGETIRAEGQFFSATQGGVLCPNCGPQFAVARQVSVAALKYLRHFQRSDYEVAKKAQPASSVRAEVEALLQYYITYILERPLNSPGFIAQVKK